MAKICVPVCARRISDMQRAVERAAEVGDIIELRLDYLPEEALAQASEVINEIIKLAERPLIVTLRPSEFGGARAITIEDRLLARIEQQWLGHPKVLSDMELDLVQVLQQREEDKSLAEGVCDWNRTICSFHDFAGIPDDLEQIYEHMAATPARVLKIAVQADDATDCVAILNLLKRAKHQGREMIAIAMGDAGIMTRILGPSRGSFLTYGAFDDETATAPGQVTATDLREIYRIEKIDSHTEIFGVIGDPITHSLSPLIHNTAFAAAGLNSVYLPLKVRDLTLFMRRMVHPKTRELDWNLRGLSVTAPHKSAVIDQLDWIDPTAQEIGAVNTVLIKEGQLRGYNTDAEGFILPLRSRFGSVGGARCAVIGAGGAARAVVWALHHDGARVTVWARNTNQAKELAEGYGAEWRVLTNEPLANFDIVVNTTPLGTLGEYEDQTPFTAPQLGGVRLACDLVYNPIETRFLREARQAGCETLSGIEMLLMQAAVQFRLWQGRELDAQAARLAVFKALERLK